MTAKLDAKITKLEEKKKALEEKKKIAVEKEKRRKFKKKEKRYIEIGRLAEKANLFDFDIDTLFGAFLEIYEKSSSHDSINSWKEKAKSKNEDNTPKTPLSISFSTNPTKEEKKLMKEISFSFNSFRNEFYGYGDFEKIAGMVSQFECKVEKLDN